MKKITLFSLLLLSSFVGFSQSNPLIGEWSTINTDNKSEKFSFKGDNTAIMTKNGQAAPPFAYTLDTSKSPHWIDFLIDEGDFKMKMQGLVAIVDEETIKLELFPEENGVHPTKFSEGSSSEISTVILKKI